MFGSNVKRFFICFACCVSLILLPLAPGGLAQGIIKKTKEGIQKGTEGVKKGAKVGAEKTKEGAKATEKGVKKGTEVAVENTKKGAKATEKSVKKAVTDDDKKKN